MTLRQFLSLASIVALDVGTVALLQPTLLLESKGAVANAAANVWMRETGIALVAIGVMAWQMRHQPDSASLRAFLAGNALLQLGLLVIEVVAFADGVITRGSGIAPNVVLHVVLSVGFVYFARARPASLTSEPRGR